MISAPMMVLLSVFWSCMLVGTYTWLGYPLLLFLMRCFRRRADLGEQNRQAHCPSVSIIIAAHNEESVIGRRIRNCLDLDYPADKFEIIVASDHSIDKTEEIVLSFRDPRVRLLHAQQRGKSLAQNEAMRQAKGDILVFTDADTLFAVDFLERIARPFADPRVGCASGRLVITNPRDTAITHAGNRYWQYEFTLWRLENQLGILALAGGMCMAVHKDLFRPISPHLGEDTVVPLDVLNQGYRVVFVPEAVAYQQRLASPSLEVEARSRMTLRSLTGTLGHARLLNPFYHPGVAWAIISHKLLRWFTPCFLLAVFGINLMLLDVPFYRLILGLQLAFYITAVLGYMTDRLDISLPWVSLPYTFCLANVGFLIGVWKALRGEHIVAYR